MTVTQLVNPDIDRVDAVNGPATGLPFLMFKSLDAPVEAETVEKSAEEAPAEAPAADEAPAEEVTKSAEEASEEEAPADEAPEEVEKSAEDAATAQKAAKNLAVLRNVVKELASAEDAEEPYSSDAFDLMDAGAAIDYALGVLAKFALTEQIDSSSVEKALHLSVHDGEEAPADPAAPAHAEAPAAPHAPAHAEAPAAPHAPAAAPAAAEKPLPSGLQEILDTFVESYSRYKEALDSGAQAALAEDDVNNPNPTPEVPAAPAAHPAPAVAHEEPPAAAPAAPEAPAKPVAPEAAPAAAEAPAEAPAEDPEVPPKKVAKSMDELIAEAVSKAVEAVQTPLLKRIDVLERMPADSGSPMLAGQTPGNPGNPLQGGQAEGVAKGLGNQSTAPQAAPGGLSLTDALKGAWGVDR